MNSEDCQIPTFFQNQITLIVHIDLEMKKRGENLTIASKTSGVSYSTLSAIHSGNRDAGKTSRKNVELMAKYLRMSVVDYYRECNFLKDEDFSK